MERAAWSDRTPDHETRTTEDAGLRGSLFSDGNSNPFPFFGAATRRGRRSRRERCSRRRRPRRGEFRPSTGGFTGLRRTLACFAGDTPEAPGFRVVVCVVDIRALPSVRRVLHVRGVSVRLGSTADSPCKPADRGSPALRLDSGDDWTSTRVDFCFCLDHHAVKTSRAGPLTV